MLTQWHIFAIIFTLKCIFHRDITRSDDNNEWYVTLVIGSISMFVYWLLAGWLVEPLNLIFFGEVTPDIGTSTNEYDNPKPQ